MTVAVRGVSSTSAISPKKSPAWSVLIDSPVLGHVGVALEQDEELAAGLALPGQLLAFLEVDLVGELRDLLELAARAVGEQRRPLDQVDLLVTAQHNESVSVL